MKYLIFFIILIFNIQKLNAQEDNLTNIGKQIFESIRDIDTAKINRLIPKKEDFLGYINESSDNNRDIQVMIKDFDQDSANFKVNAFNKLKSINKRGQDIGINWEKAVYKSTEIKSINTENSFKNTHIYVWFSFNKKEYILETILIYYKKYFIVSEIFFEGK
ncbi:hypothetical protein [Flavobacterium koreense]